MILTTTNQSIIITSDATATSNEPVVVTDYADHTSSAFTPGAQLATLSGTAEITTLSAPASSTQRQLKYLNIYNVDSVAHVITVKYNDNGTKRTLFKDTVNAGKTLFWTPEDGWVNTGKVTTIGAETYTTAVILSSDKSTGGADPYYVSWDSAAVDDLGFWDSGSPTLLTAPAAGYIRAEASLWVGAGLTNPSFLVIDDGSGTSRSAEKYGYTSPNGGTIVCPWNSVAKGDVFRFYLSGNAVARTLQASLTRFAISFKYA